MKKAFKFATGQVIPEGAVYLNTVTQTVIFNESDKSWGRCWLVWHYFLVDGK